MAKDDFDAIGYFRRLTLENKLTKRAGFVPVTISSSDNLEGLLEQFGDNDRFVAVSDTSSGNLSSDGGTYAFFNRRAYTVFVLAAYEWGDEESRQEALGMCRRIFHQFVSRIIRDKYEYADPSMYFNTGTFPNQELGKYYLSGLTGLHFTVYMEEPLDLEYDGCEWETD